MESQFTSQLPYDVLIQFLVTLAVGDGFDPDFIFPVVKRAASFAQLSQTEMNWMMDFITKGGNSLGNYEDFLKVSQDDDGLYKVKSKKIAMKHRLSMGTIVSDAMIKVKFKNGACVSHEKNFDVQLDHT